MNKEMIGREGLADYIKTVTAEEKMSHAYILEGEKGMGKLFVAKYFAKAILCSDKKEGELHGKKATSPCMNCVACKQLESGNHPDLIYVEHEKPNVIGADDIKKQVLATVDILPYSSKYKVYIIKDAEKMNDFAQNALLKTIEEPPQYVIIFLLSANKGRLFETIKSRCVTLDVKPVEKDVIRDFLMEQYQIPDYRADYAAKFSAGNIGRAIRYAIEEDFLAMRNMVVNIMKRLDEERTSDLIEDIAHLNDYKNEIKDCLDLITLWFRDMLVLKATADVNRLLFQEEYGSLKEQANVRSYEAIENALLALEKAKQRIEANVNFETVIEVMLLSLKEK